MRPPPPRAPLPELALPGRPRAAPVVLPPLGFSHDLLGRALNCPVRPRTRHPVRERRPALLRAGRLLRDGGVRRAYLVASGTIGSVWVALLVGTVAAGGLGLAVGWLAVRRIGIYFAMITLAFGQMAYFIENGPLSAYTGGENGIGACPPGSRLRNPTRCDHRGPAMYALLRRPSSSASVLARRIARSPVGLILKAVKENAGRVAMLGHDVPPTSSRPSPSRRSMRGLPGDARSVPELHAAGRLRARNLRQLVVQSIVGGVGTLVGPLVGAALWLWLRDNLQPSRTSARCGKLVLGLAFSLVMGLRRESVARSGTAGRIRRDAATLSAGGGAQPARSRPRAGAGRGSRRRGRPGRSPARRSTSGRRRPASPSRRGSLARHYGGLKGGRRRELPGPARSIHAVIGPNGPARAPCTRCSLSDSSLAERRRGPCCSASACDRRGVARGPSGAWPRATSSTALPGLSVRDNLRVAALAPSRGRFRLDLLRPADSRPEVEAQVAAMLAVPRPRRAGRYAGQRGWPTARSAGWRSAWPWRPVRPFSSSTSARRHEPARRAATCALIRRSAAPAPWSSSSTTSTRCSGWPSGSRC